MALQDHIIITNRWHRRFLWVGAAALAVLLALGMMHYLNSVQVFGVAAVDGRGELQKEEKPALPPG